MACVPCRYAGDDASAAIAAVSADWFPSGAIRPAFVASFCYDRTRTFVLEMREDVYRCI